MKHMKRLLKWVKIMITGNLLDYEYFSKHCKLVVIDLSKQIELKNLDLKMKLIS